MSTCWETFPELYSKTSYWKFEISLCECLCYDIQLTLQIKAFSPLESQLLYTANTSLKKSFLSHKNNASSISLITGPGQIQAQTQLCKSLQRRQMNNQRLMIMKRMSQWAAFSVMLPNWLTVDQGLRGRHSFTVFLDFQLHYPEKSANSSSEATKVEKYRL